MSITPTKKPNTRKPSSQWKRRKNAVPLTERGAFQLPQAADCMTLSLTTVRHLIKRGLIQPLPGIRHIVIEREECDRFLHAQREIGKLAA